MERTYLMIKPDGVQRGLIGEIITRIEKKGLKIAGLKMLKISKETAEKHYGEHIGKPFFDSLVDYITSGPVVAMAVEGNDVVTTTRELMGATNPLKAAPGTIRATYGMDMGRNIIHGSDSNASAAREINIFFLPEELVEYTRVIDRWIYE